MTSAATQQSSTEEWNQPQDTSQFDACTLYYLTFSSCFAGFVIVVGLIGNSVTMVIMGRERNTSSTINCLFLLAIVDSLILLTYAFMLVPIGIRKTLYGRWSGHNYNYVAMLFIGEVARIFNQVSACITMLVTFQRYVSICLPHRAKQFCSVRLVNLTTIFTCFASVIFYMPNFFLYSLAKDSAGRYHAISNPIVVSPTFQMLYLTAATGMITYVIPISSLGFMSTRILQTMKAQSKVVKSSAERSKARRDLTLSSIAIVILFVICQSFSAIQRVLMWVYDPFVVAVRCGGNLFYFSLVPQVAMVINSASNFVIYVILAKGFRRKVRRLFVSKNRVAPNNSSTDGVMVTVASVVQGTSS